MLQVAKVSRCGVDLSKETLHPEEAFVSHAIHANAALTPRARLRLARVIVNQGSHRLELLSAMTCLGGPRRRGPTATATNAPPA